MAHQCTHTQSHSHSYTQIEVWRVQNAPLIAYSGVADVWDARQSEELNGNKSHNFQAAFKRFSERLEARWRDGENRPPTSTRQTPTYVAWKCRVAIAFDSTRHTLPSHFAIFGASVHRLRTQSIRYTDDYTFIHKIYVHDVLVVVVILFLSEIFHAICVQNGIINGKQNENPYYIFTSRLNECDVHTHTHTPERERARTQTRPDRCACIRTI